MNNEEFTVEEPAVRAGSDLTDYFHSIRHSPDKLARPIYISAHIRFELLVGLSQGKITINGRVRDIEFENIGGGVWTACLPDVDKPKYSASVSGGIIA